MHREIFLYLFITTIVVVIIEFLLNEPLSNITVCTKTLEKYFLSPYFKFRSHFAIRFGHLER